MSLKTLFLSLCLLLMGLVWLACVDPPTGAPSIPEPPHTLARFAHVAPGVGSVNVTIDNAGIGSAAFGQTTPYTDFLFGNRIVGIGAFNQAVNFGAEQQQTVLIHLSGGSPAYLLLNEGSRFLNGGIDTVARVRFVNVADGSAPSLIFRSDSSTGADLETASFGAVRPFITLDPGSRAISVVSGGGYTAGAINGAQEVPAVTTQTTGSGSVLMTADGGITYELEVRSKNSDGFFTMAHIHNAATGTNGPVVATLDVSNQAVSIPDAGLSGANEVPAVTTNSHGTGTFTLNKTDGLTYSIHVDVDNTNGFFTAAHFHNAPAGSNGPVVQAIDVTKQMVSFPVTALSGAQVVPPVAQTTATGSATFTLYRDSLQYSITVTRDVFDTSFTGANFRLGAAGLVGPVVKTISSTTFGNQTFTGTWKSTDTEPLTSVLVGEILAGNVYVNFESQGHPLGLLRAQLINDDMTTNTFAGTWSGETLTDALLDEFAYGNIYVNFHTATNPGGEIRAQVTPDEFTTNTYEGTLAAGTIPAALRSLFNSGGMYVNFHTASHPSGLVRGQLAVDPDAGEYGVATMAASEFLAGRVYTVVAVGSGSTLELIKLSNRQAGVAKPAHAVTFEEVKSTVSE